MSNETRPFPVTRQDVSALRQTATDAVNDLTSAASLHATKAKDQLHDLAGDFQEEGGQHLEKVGARLSDVTRAARDFAYEKPFVCIGAALALGFIFGFSRRR
ncbi:MAG: hypothetical protein LV479_10040 [Methylacidiphilales bacterium]|nr:hypothetical protein [Candidatus Methylacidiphilales bacterium]